MGDGRASRNWAEQGADLSVGPKPTVFSALQGKVSIYSEHFSQARTKKNLM
jgi:hypothetical protein